MSSFTVSDYKRVFEIGRRVYGTGHTRETREFGVELMWMAESVIGQQIWPNLPKHYRMHIAQLQYGPEGHP